MSATVRKIVIILVGIVIIPILVYTGLEVKQVQENEKMMQEIYLRQLDAIIFSINQYSNDVFTGIANKLEFYNPMRQEESTSDMLRGYKGLQGLYLEDVSSGATLIVDSEENRLVSQGLRKLEGEHGKVKERLVRYKKANFLKIEPIKTADFEDDIYMLAFVLEPEKDQFVYCVAFVNGLKFVETYLVPKVQQVAAEGFVIQFTKEGRDGIIYQTDEPENEESYAKNLWLLPDYQLQISIRGNTIQSLVRERSRFNLYVIAGVSIVLMLGVWLVFTNIRKEIQLAQTKSDFVSNVSHEIRTPLALISMFAETLLLGRAKSEEKKLEYYDIISKETARLRNIVNKILNFSQIEANKKQYHKGLYNLNNIVEEVLSTYSFHLQNKGFEFDLEFGPLELMVNADKEAVVEALINLLDNAIKYSLDDKEIMLRTSQDGHYAVLQVEDKGVGIDDKRKKQIFEKFYRVTDGDIYKVQGAGLGLSIVKHIMDAHQGKIVVESQPGNGSVFKLYFPIANQ